MATLSNSKQWVVCIIALMSIPTLTQIIYLGLSINNAGSIIISPIVSGASFFLFPLFIYDIFDSIGLLHQMSPSGCCTMGTRSEIFAFEWAVSLGYPIAFLGPALLLQYLVKRNVYPGTSFMIAAPPGLASTIWFFAAFAHADAFCTAIGC